MSYEENSQWSVNKIQPIAIKQIYNKIWPNAKIIELDKDRKDLLKVILDKSGSDKLIKFNDGGIAFLGQRFRRISNTKNYDDFTLRVWNYVAGEKVEFNKILMALENNRNVANYYAYGHVNLQETGFSKFRIIDFPKFLSLVASNRLPPYQRIKTNEKDAEFLCWKFKKIPPYCFIYNSERKITLEAFF